jgi:hypothetical protein
MSFMDNRFYIEITDEYGKFVESSFKRSVGREIKGFKKVLNSFKILDI